MTDSLSKMEDPNGDGRVNIHDDQEIKYWSTKFAVSTGDLVDAVNAVGEEAGKVEEYLVKKKKGK